MHSRFKRILTICMVPTVVLLIIGLLLFCIGIGDMNSSKKSTCMIAYNSVNPACVHGQCEYKVSITITNIKNGKVRANTMDVYEAKTENEAFNVMNQKYFVGKNITCYTEKGSNRIDINKSDGMPAVITGIVFLALTFVMIVSVIIVGIYYHCYLPNNDLEYSSFDHWFVKYC